MRKIKIVVACLLVSLSGYAQKKTPSYSKIFEMAFKDENHQCYEYIKAGDYTNQRIILEFVEVISEGDLSAKEFKAVLDVTIDLDQKTIKFALDPQNTSKKDSTKVFNFEKSEVNFSFRGEDHIASFSSLGASIQQTTVANYLAKILVDMKKSETQQDPKDVAIIPCLIRLIHEIK